MFLAADADLNNIRTPGIYYWNDQRTNQPTGTFSSAMVYYDVPNTLGWQVLYTNPENYIYMRSYRYSNSTWSSWQRIDNYGTASLAELASALGVVSLSGTSRPAINVAKGLDMLVTSEILRFGGNTIEYSDGTSRTGCYGIVFSFNLFSIDRYALQIIYLYEYNQIAYRGKYVGNLDEWNWTGLKWTKVDKL